MNRGDFVHVQLPKTFRIVSPNKYQTVNGFVSTSSGFALGTFAAAPAALNFTIPKSVLDDLAADGLVTATTVDLYDDARNPVASQSNFDRYVSLLKRLASVEVDDGP
ncbi:MAG TPA: hypothetical protein VHE32_03940 [Rhodanobacteraceae bacterium]|nr:hypothetical protein [Rhodanobacteraceae bacterium]